MRLNASSVLADIAIPSLAIGCYLVLFGASERVCYGTWNGITCSPEQQFVFLLNGYGATYTMPVVSTSWNYQLNYVGILVILLGIVALAGSIRTEKGNTLPIEVSPLSNPGSKRVPSGSNRWGSAYSAYPGIFGTFVH
jgi:hypothetical protein